MTTATHATTLHLRKAATHLRRAHDATKDDRREVIELGETLAAVTVVVHRLPAIIGHLRSLVHKADAHLYTYDDGSLSAEEALNLLETCLTAASAHVDNAERALIESWSVLLQVRLHDPDAPQRE